MSGLTGQLVLAKNELKWHLGMCADCYEAGGEIVHFSKYCRGYYMIGVFI